MILPLTKNLRVETKGGSSPEFTLQRCHVVGSAPVAGKVPKNAGEEVWRVLGYYGSLDSAMHRAIVYHLADLDGEWTLADVVREIRELKAKISEAVG